jgi:hypothetical protein
MMQAAVLSLRTRIGELDAVEGQLSGLPGAEDGDQVG